MNYVLIKVDQQPFKNGDPCKRIPVALSNTPAKLIEYCKKSGMQLGEPQLFSYDDYYIIRESKVIIL